MKLGTFWVASMLLVGCQPAESRLLELETEVAIASIDMIEPRNKIDSLEKAYKGKGDLIDSTYLAWADSLSTKQRKLDLAQRELNKFMGGGR